MIHSHYPNKKNRGFTLIELLVVIAIIALLTSVVLASLNVARAKSRDATRIAEVREVQIALQLYANDHSGFFPASSTSYSIGGLNALVSGKYLAKLPLDPVLDGGACRTISGFCYYSGTPYSTYHLGVQLESSARKLNPAALSSGGGGDFNGYSAGSADYIYDTKNI